MTVRMTQTTPTIQLTPPATMAVQFITTTMMISLMMVPIPTTILTVTPMIWPGL